MMKRNGFWQRVFTVLSLVLCVARGAAGATFTIATYNVENYLDAPSGMRKEKPPEARAKVQQIVRAMAADVIAFEEMGSVSALEELRAAVKERGLDYPYLEHVSAADQDIHVALLSRFPIVARRSHTNETFLLAGKRFAVKRGFIDVDIRVSPHYEFTLMAAHLKSRLPVPDADQAEIREEEAMRLREIIDAKLRVRPDMNLVVLGDFNDTRDSKPVKTIIGGRGKFSLFDTRPAERNGDSAIRPKPGYSPRNITWTYFYGKEDTYSRIDFILLSHGMAREWRPELTSVLAVPDWGAASDHRPIIAGFEAEER
jgi:endonuclease/exonuclease/phosphatase family metal-dependent hydrolase